MKFDVNVIDIEFHSNIFLPSVVISDEKNKISTLNKWWSGADIIFTGEDVYCVWNGIIQSVPNVKWICGYGIIFIPFDRRTVSMQICRLKDCINSRQTLLLITFYLMDILLILNKQRNAE